MNRLLVWIMIESTAMLETIIWVIFSIVKKRELFPRIFEGKEDIVVKILVLAAVAYVVVDGIVPECMDLPYYYNNEYCYMEGVAQTHSDRSARGPHSLYMKDVESGEEIHVTFSYEGTIERGDRLKVKYLPNSKHAILLEVNGRKQM